MFRLFTMLLIGFSAAYAVAEEPPTMTSVLEASGAADWVVLEQQSLLYLFLDEGVIVFELAPQFAPRHVANIERLAAAEYWDGLAVVRSQDNYVAQWGDPAAGTETARPLSSAEDSLAPEFFRARDGLAFTAIESRDAYAPEVGFVDGFPAGRDEGRAWLAHCYGMLGVGRGNDIDSGSGAELYVVTGHAPRHLDRNVTLVGRAIHGIEHLSSLPRGTGPLGFYEAPEQHVSIRRIRLGTDLEADEQLGFRRLRTDTDTFVELVDARRHRREAWFADPAGRIGLCNVPVPIQVVDPR